MLRPLRAVIPPIVNPVVDTTRANLPVWQPPTVTAPIVDDPSAVAPPVVTPPVTPLAPAAWTPPTVTAPVVNNAVPTVGAPAPFDPRAQRADLSSMPSALDAPTLPTVAPVDPYTKAQQDYMTAVGSQEHPSKWLSGLFLALQGLSKTVNPNDPTPVRTLADARHDENVKDALSRLQPFQQQADANSKRADAQSKRDLEDAQRQYFLGRNDTTVLTNTIKDQGLTQRTIMRANNTLNAINRRADVAAGRAKPVINTNGQLELEYLNADSSGNRKPNELLLGADKKPITVPGEEGVEWTNPVTNQQELIKAKQDVGYATGQERINETNRHNTTTEAQGQQRIDFEKNVMQPYREAGLKLRQDEFNFRQAGNPKAADTANRQRVALVSSIKARQQEGKLSEEDANALINELNAPLGGTANAEKQP